MRSAAPSGSQAMADEENIEEGGEDEDELYTTFDT